MNKEQATDIIGEIESITQNIKAEIIVAHLLNLGLSIKDTTIHNEGSFTRPYRKDILKISAIEYSFDNFELHFSLTRNGIYDLLPEGVSHSQDSVSAVRNAKTFAADCLRRKKETEEARKFFKPIENAIFHQLVKLEQKEEELLIHDKTSFYEFMIAFWKVKRMPQPYEGFLVRLMPHMHSFAGNFPLLCICLEKILKIPVKYTIQQRTLSVPSPKDGSTAIRHLQCF